MYRPTNFFNAPIRFLILTFVFAGCRPSSAPNSNNTSNQPEHAQRTHLSFSFLQEGKQGTLIDFSAYGIPTNASLPKNTFEGKLTLLNLETSGQFQEVKDRYGYTDSVESVRKHLPPFDYEFIQSGSYIIPRKRGYLINAHETWEYILEPGRVWDEDDDQGFSRVAIPFTLKQKNQNCLHNGVLTFLFKNDGTTSSAAYQIASETCAYFKFNMWGTVNTSYSSYAIDGKEKIIERYQTEIENRLPVKPIEELTKRYPNANPQAFSAPGEISPEHMTLYGFVIDSVNYVGGCETRFGTYPFCEVLNVPSYSTAKSISAGLGLMRMEKIYPGIRKKFIGDLVPSCGSDIWKDVTLENALDMATGNYDTLKPFTDEGARHTNIFFSSLSHKGKIEYSCSQYQRKSAPGTQMVYHSSDTYIVGTAMNAYLKRATQNPTADYFNDVIVKDILDPLYTSPTVKVQQTTYDNAAQPFSGFGLFYHHDDVAKIGLFLNNGAKIKGQPMLDEDMFASIMQNNNDAGLEVNSPGSRYDNGFWLRNVNHPTQICEDRLLIPALEGYGGIKIFLLPNNTVYYFFSDNYEYGGTKGIIESNKIKPFCN